MIDPYQQIQYYIPPPMPPPTQPFYYQAPVYAPMAQVPNPQIPQAPDLRGPPPIPIEATRPLPRRVASPASTHTDYPDPPPVRTSRLKLPEIAKINGLNRIQIRNFFHKMQQTFILDAAAFPNDRVKIQFATLHFEGQAYSWWQGQSDLPEDDPIRTDWTHFVIAFNSLFGDPNRQLTVVANIRALCMAHGQHASSYIVKFQTYAYETRFNDVALASCFYEGLPNRLKDALSLAARPDTYSALCEKVIELDNRFWECQLEKNCKAQSSPNSNPVNVPPQPATPSGPGPTTPRNAPNTNTTLPRVPLPERQRRRTENLCLRCGKPGHLMRDCTNPVKTGRLAFQILDDDPDETDELFDHSDDTLGDLINLDDDPPDLPDTPEEGNAEPVPTP